MSPHSSKLLTTGGGSATLGPEIPKLGALLFISIAPFYRNSKMPRACNPDLTIDWKVPLPATLAGAVELELFDRLTGKPRYGERSKLIAYLLSSWLQARGRRVEVEPPSEDLIPETKQ